MADDLREVCNRLGVDVEKLNDTAVLVLPENFDSAKSRDDLYDANGSILLAKNLKSLQLPPAR